ALNSTKICFEIRYFSRYDYSCELGSTSLLVGIVSSLAVLLIPIEAAFACLILHRANMQELPMRRVVECLRLAAILGLMTGTGVKAGLIVSVDAPHVQASTVSGVTTETFNGFSTGTLSSLNTAVGTVSSAASGHFAVVDADVFGGAGGTGKYFSIGA